MKTPMSPFARSIYLAKYAARDEDGLARLKEEAAGYAKGNRE